MTLSPISKRATTLGSSPNNPDPIGGHSSPAGVSSAEECASTDYLDATRVNAAGHHAHPAEVMNKLLTVQNRAVDPSLTLEARRALINDKVNEMVALFSSSYVSEQPQVPGGGFTGVETVRAHWSGLFSLDNFSVKMEGNLLNGKPTNPSLLGGNTWVANQLWSGTYAATGQPFNLPVNIAYEIAGGKITKGWVFFLAPPPAPPQPL